MTRTNFLGFLLVFGGAAMLLAAPVCRPMRATITLVLRTIASTATIGWMPFRDTARARISRPVMRMP